MPKIIENIEETILTIATQKFNDFGYQNVDMRLIAKAAGIAVGTLYNYYPNKRALFSASLESSWENTVKAMKEVFSTDDESYAKLLRGFIIFYDGLESRNGLGGQMILNEAMSQKKTSDESQSTAQLLKGFWQDVQMLIEKELYSLFEKGFLMVGEDQIEFLANSWMSTLMVLKQSERQRQDKLAYITTMIDMAMKRKDN